MPWACPGHPRPPKAAQSIPRPFQTIPRQPEVLPKPSPTQPNAAQGAPQTTPRQPKVVPKASLNHPRWCPRHQDAPIQLQDIPNPPQSCETYENLYALIGFTVGNIDGQLLEKSLPNHALGMPRPPQATQGCPKHPKISPNHPKAAQSDAQSIPQPPRWRPRLGPGTCS